MRRNCVCAACQAGQYMMGRRLFLERSGTACISHSRQERPCGMFTPARLISGTGAHTDTAVLSATFIISRKLVCLSWADIDSPVTMESETVNIARAFACPSAALQ